VAIVRPGTPDRPGDSRLRVGLVGAGFIGRTHLAAWRSEGIDVVVFDVDPARSSSLAEPFGASVAPNMEALFAATDVVDICTPTHLHAPVAVAAARAGRHVICEKPLARTLADGEAMLAAARQAGVRLLVGQVVRFYPEYAAAHKAVMAGAIGDPAVLRLTRANSRPRQPADHWFFDHARSGGIILDLMIHDLDFARWVAGEVVSVACRSAAFERPDAGVDHAVAILTHASGAISHVSASWAYAPPTSRTAFEIAGSRGLIEQDSDRTAAVERSLQAGGASGRATSLVDGALGGEPFRVELAEFARAIEANVTPRTDGEDALETLRLALAADQSARSFGRTVRLEAGAGA
jgi:predicted dehydrogenase